MKPSRLFMLALCLLATRVSADIRVAKIFGDNMVLQRDMPVPIWGWAEPGEKVTVEALGKTYSTQTDTSGKWVVKIGPFKAGGPNTLTIKGNNTVTIKDVWLGEVWICSGQSNMEWTLNGSKNAAEERAAANYPKIRHVKIDRTTSLTPLDDAGNSGWQVCSSTTAGNFTAVGYYFGRHLFKELNVPIGLINTSWGGTIVETWTSAESLKTHPDFKARIAEFESMGSDAKGAAAAYQKQLVDWQKAYDEALNSDDEKWQVAEHSDADWKSMKLPGNWEDQGLPGFDGIVWFRKTVEIPASWAGKNVTLSMSPIDDIDTTWVNGTRVGGLTDWNVPRRYSVAGSLVKAGPLTIAVRVHDTGGGGGFHGAANLMTLSCEGESPISIAGDWKYNLSKAMAKVPPKPAPPPFQSGPNHPTLLYNAMVNPIVPFAFRGAIWYQGESNAGRAYQYRSIFPLLIEDWRAKWGQGDFPFYFVQLANFMAPNTEPQESAWAELREAQSMTLKLPKTGQAVIIDIGEARDIHPRNKQDVGKRLALHAMNLDYGAKDVVYSGPVYKSMQKDGSKIRLAFRHIGGGLKAIDDKPLKHFSIAGADRKFVWGEAKIEGSEVVVSSASVPDPVAVRYAWANNPEGCNLYNAEGLPASPFRTDDWPGVTVNNK